MTAKIRCFCVFMAIFGLFVINSPQAEAQSRDGGKSESGDLSQTGSRVSINYQHGDIRTLLRLMAEEMGLRVVFSETVQGGITLVLKDVRPDQVMDIIFRQKSLDLRKNGDVILIADRDEFDILKRFEFPDCTRSELQPLSTEAFQLIHHNVANALRQVLGDKEQCLLSKYGQMLVDPRSNTLYIKDEPSRLADLRWIITKSDIPVDESCEIDCRTSLMHEVIAKSGIPIRRMIETPHAKIEDLREAVQVTRKILEGIDEKTAPDEWAIVQGNLGHALGVLGERENNAEYLREAVDAFRSALEILNPK
ncbi:MAG: hypothetical protein LBQ81_08760, partial [Zoogloeaceae bacterium]|nr:hypothetical protein [Zoogloeaceae bacterium]